MDVDLNELVHVGRLSDWLDTHVPELGKGPLKCELLHGGTSNVVFTLDRGEQQMVLRRPPAVPPPGAEVSSTVPPSAATVSRTIARPRPKPPASRALPR